VPQLEAASAPAADEPGFSPLEEAFFASEVAPVEEADLPRASWGDRIDAVLCDWVDRLRRRRARLLTVSTESDPQTA